MGPRLAKRRHDKSAAIPTDDVPGRCRCGAAAAARGVAVGGTSGGMLESQWMASYATADLRCDLAIVRIYMS